MVIAIFLLGLTLAINFWFANIRAVALRFDGLVAISSRFADTRAFALRFGGLALTISSKTVDTRAVAAVCLDWVAYSL